MSTLQRKILTFCISWVPVCESIAQEMKTDRPDLTESAATVDKSYIQLEAGWQSGQTITAQGVEKTTLAPVLLTRIGLTKNIELRLAGQYFNGSVEKSKASGLGDLEFGAKIQCFENRNKTFVLGLLHHLVIPTGNINGPAGEFQTVNKLLCNHVLPYNVSVEYNLGYTTGKDDAYTYTLALGKSLVENVAGFVETFGEYTNTSGMEINLDAGFTCLVHKDIQFDVSYGLGLNHSMRYLSAGISWRFKK